MSTLTCPKCQGDMRSYERNGVTVDQCGDCRGIFLDRGELEHLIEADARAHPPAPGPSSPSAAMASAPPPGRPGSLPYDDRHDDDYDYRRSGHSGHQKKRKKSWVDELFD